MRRIGILTSGGDCQALNATMRGVAKSLYNMLDDVEIIGFEDGYKGLMYADYQIMKPADFSGILTQGGTILGTSRQPFKQMRVPDENGLDKVEAMKHTYKKLKLSCLVVLGGNGSQKTANMLSEEGLNVVSLPKTIDNDLWGTDMTFGFQSAVEVATNAIDCIHTTALPRKSLYCRSYGDTKLAGLPYMRGLQAARISFFFGDPIRYQGSLRCYYQTDKSRKTFFHSCSGWRELFQKEDASISKKELKEKKKNGVVYPSVAYEIGAKIQEVTGSEVRVTVPGHMQRGGEPCPYDRVLATRLGAAAAELIINEEYGYMAALKNNEITKVPLSEVAGKLKTVDPNCSMIKEAKRIGISFGDQ